MIDAPVFVVTGGSRGIGAAVALTAADRGWRVLLNYASNEAAAQSVANTITAKGGVAKMRSGVDVAIGAPAQCSAGRRGHCAAGTR